MTPCCMVWYTIPTMQSVFSLIWTNLLNGQSCGKWPSTHRSVTLYAFAEVSVPLYTHTLCLAILYRLHVDHYPYLGVSLSENLNWKPHILNITNKANSTLGFVKRKLHCPQKVKDHTYKSLVRPRLKNGFIVWDPYRAFQKSWLEQVQRGAARFVTRTYTREEGWTNALKLLNWPILEKKRQVAKLTLMYKCRCWYLLVCTSSVFPKNQSISSTEMWHVQIRTASGRELSLTVIAYHLII